MYWVVVDLYVFLVCYLLLVGENWTFIIICVFCNETNKQNETKKSIQVLE